MPTSTMHVKRRKQCHVKHNNWQCVRSSFRGRSYDRDACALTLRTRVCETAYGIQGGRTCLATSKVRRNTEMRRNMCERSCRKKRLNINGKRRKQKQENNVQHNLVSVRTRKSGNGRWVLMETGPSRQDTGLATKCQQNRKRFHPPCEPAGENAIQNALLENTWIQICVDAQVQLKFMD